jgi:hypothetical protein
MSVTKKSLTILKNFHDLKSLEQNRKTFDFLKTVFNCFNAIRTKHKIKFITCKDKANYRTKANFK